MHRKVSFDPKKSIQKSVNTFFHFASIRFPLHKHETELEDQKPKGMECDK